MQVRWFRGTTTTETWLLIDMVRTPIYENILSAPNPFFTPPSHVGNSITEYKRVEAVKEVCRYCLYIAREYRFDMEPEFCHDDNDPFGTDIIFRFKAPSPTRERVYDYGVRISGKKPLDYVMCCIKDVACESAFIVYNILHGIKPPPIPLKTER